MIELLIDFGFAWISVGAALLLCLILLLRLVLKNKPHPGLLKVNTFLRIHHKKIGIILIVSGLIHGIFSSEKVLSFNIGTLAWGLSLLLGITWILRKILPVKKSWLVYHRFLSIVFAGVLIWHIVDVGGIQGFSILKNEIGGYYASALNNNNNDTGTLPASSSLSSTDSDSSSVSSTTTNTIIKEVNEDMTGNIYRDGTFTGEAQGYRPGLKVSVTIKNNKIVSIKITEHNEENSRFYTKPINTIPQKIIAAQNLEVDVVSGATFTSTGIINAVRNALSQALVSGELQKELALPSKRRH